jgi:hypothetical protein
MSSVIDPSEVTIFFNRYQSETQKLIDQADFGRIPPLGGKSARDALPDIVAAFDSAPASDLIQRPPTILVQLKETIVDQFRACERSHTILFNTWPPVLPGRETIFGMLMLFLLNVIHDCHRPLEFLTWLMAEAISPSWHASSPQENQILSVVSMCKQKKRADFALLDRDGYLRIDSRTDGAEPKMVCNAKVLAIQTSGKSVKITLEDGATRVFSPPNPRMWVDIPAFPLTLSGLEPPFPKPLLVSFFHSLCGDDMIVLRALVQFGVVPVNEGVPFMGALIDIFAFAGKTDAFLVTVASMEFMKDELRGNTVLRGNTHVTNLFKAWFAKYARPYYDACLTKLLDYVISVGDVGLSRPDCADAAKAEKLLFTVMKSIIASGSAIPPAVRHLASILKAFAIVRFNNKQATYNTLAGYICLRFITAVIADPVVFRPGTEAFHPEVMRMLMPFSQLLQVPINLAPLDGRFEDFAGWNKRLEKHVWPKLVGWMLAVADLPEKPVYELPTEEKVMEALTVVLAALSANFGKFSDQYRKLTEGPAVPHPISWSLASFFSMFFEENA